MDRAPLPFSPGILLSEEYRALNAELHRREPSYGTTGRKYVNSIRRLAKGISAKQILDYGCGKRDLERALSGEFQVCSYDPALPGIDSPPARADLVACIDVLEHVEPEYLESVLADLARVTGILAFLTIATRPSGKRLADGTNPHRIVQCADWWLCRIGQHFHVSKAEIPPTESGLQVIAKPRR